MKKSEMLARIEALEARVVELEKTSHKQITLDDYHKKCPTGTGLPQWPPQTPWFPANPWLNDQGGVPGYTPGQPIC